ncbi:MAG: hypothetical protein R6V85_18875 [Polyangia bacterium]
MSAKRREIVESRVRRAAAALFAIVVFCGCGRCQEDPGSAQSDAASDDAAPGESARSGEERDRGAEDLPGSIRIVPVEVSGAGDLDEEGRRRLMALYRVSLRADELLCARRGSEYLRARRMLEQILIHIEAVPSRVAPKIRTFAKRFFAFHCGRDPLDGRPVSPRFIPGELAAAAQAALRAGAEMPTEDLPGKSLAADQLQELEALLEAVRPVIFPRREDVAPDAGDRDAGARDSGAVPDADEGPSGGGIVALLRISREAGIETAPFSAGERRVQYLRSAAGQPGEPSAIMGFRRGGIEGFGALVVIPDEKAGEVVEAIERAAPELRARISRLGAPRTPRGRARPRTVRAVQLVDAGGSWGPLLHARALAPSRGVTIEEPSSGDLWILLNVSAALDRAVGADLVRALSADTAVAERRLRCRRRSVAARRVLRELIGRGTDGTEQRAPGFLENRLGGLAPVIDELRADLAALYVALDPELADGPIFGGEECARALCEDYVASPLEWLALSQGEDSDPEQRAAIAAVRGFVQRGAVEMVTRPDGIGTLEVKGHDELREAVEEMLTEVRSIRAQGDRKRAERLLETGAPAAWKKAARLAAGRIDPPRRIGYLFPVPARGDPLRFDRSGGLLERELARAAARSRWTEIPPAGERR